MSDKERKAVTLADDAFHFPAFKTNPHSFWYTEWWYFNLLDPETNMAAEVTFAVFNPGNKFPLGVASLNSIVVVPGESPVVKMDYYGLGNFSASTQRADVEIAGHRITVVDERTYQIQAESKDGQLGFDLTFHQADSPQYLVDDMPGHDWELTSWLLYMPSARVDGTVRVGKREFPVQNATGYHDHDWGVWEVWKRSWSWADVAVPDQEFGFVLAEKGAFSRSIAYVRYGDIRLSLPDDKCNFRQSRWKRWGFFWKYPARLDFEGESADGRYRLVMSWKVNDTATLWQYPLIVFEQTAAFTGSLYERDEESGVWKRLVDIDQQGLCEATSRWL
jgi:hypothetical protein